MYSRIINYFANAKQKQMIPFLLLILIFVIAILVTFYKILALSKMGLQWDSYDFLADAVYFAGQSFGYVDFFRPPFLPFLTSLPIILGLVSELALSLVDGILFIIGVMGLYLLFKVRFNSFNSFIGVILFLSFPVVLLWIGVGYTDLSSIAISIWAIYITIQAVKKDSRLFYFILPVIMLAFLTRFTSGLIIFPIILFLTFNREKIDFKKFYIGAILSALIIAPVLYAFYQFLGNPLLVFSNFYSSSSSNVETARFALNVDPLFYFKNFLFCILNLNFLNQPITAIIGLAIYLSVIIAVITGWIQYLKEIALSLKGLMIKRIRIIIIFLFLLVFVLTLGRISYLLSDLIFVLILFGIYKSFNGNNIKYLDIDLLFISWLVSFLVFSSFYPIKVYRYLIPMTPVIAYFVMIGWSKVIQNFPKNKQTFLSIILTIILLCSIMLSLNSLYSNPIASGQNFKIIPSNNSFIFETSTQPGSGALYSETYNTQNDVKRASEWLKTYDKEYLSKNIYADYFWPHFSWFLKKGVFGLADRNNLNLELRKSNVEYFIALRYYDLADYKIVYESQTSYGYIIIYKKI